MRSDLTELANASNPELLAYPLNKKCQLYRAPRKFHVFLIGNLALTHGFWEEAHVDIAELMVNTVHLDRRLDGLKGGKGFLDGHRVVAEHVDGDADGAGLNGSGIEVIGLATDFGAGVGLPFGVGTEGGE